MVFYCNAFKSEKDGLKTIDQTLTKFDKQTLDGKLIKSTCGGFYLDDTVFKIDKKTGAITTKETESVTEVISPYCGGIKLDKNIFDVKDGMITLKKAPVVLAEATIQTANITFESLDDFTVTLTDEDGKMIEPTDVNHYVVPKGKSYNYVANNGVTELTGTISTSGRKVNFVETLVF